MTGPGAGSDARGLVASSTTAAPTGSLPPARAAGHLTSNRGLQSLYGPDAATGADSSTDRDHRFAYRAAVYRQVPVMTPEQQRSLGDILGDLPVYQLLLERERCRQRLAEVEEASAGPESLEQTYAAGERPPGGARPSPRELQATRTEIAELRTRTHRLTSQIDEQAAALGTTDEALRHVVTEGFTTLWLRRARQVLDATLDQNERQARAERARYRADESSTDVEGLLASDRRLGTIQAEIDGYTRMAGTRRADHPVFGGFAGAASADLAGLAVMPRLHAARARLRSERAAAGARYPILLTDQYRPGMFVGRPRETVAAAAGSWSDAILHDIAATREAVDDGRLHLWDMQIIPDLTWQALGLPATGPLAAVIDLHRQQEHSQAEARRRVLNALAFTAGIVATVATVGQAALLAAAAGSAGFGLAAATLSDDIQTTAARASAEGTALDRELASVREREPELLPIVFDLIGLLGEAAMAVGALSKVLRTARAIQTAQQRVVRVAAQGGRDDEVAESLDHLRGVVVDTSGDSAVAERITAEAAVQARAARRLPRIKGPSVDTPIQRLQFEEPAHTPRADRALGARDVAITADPRRAPAPRTDIHHELPDGLEGHASLYQQDPAAPVAAQSITPAVGPEQIHVLGGGRALLIDGPRSVTLHTTLGYTNGSTVITGRLPDGRLVRVLGQVSSSDPVGQAAQIRVDLEELSRMGLDDVDVTALVDIHAVRRIPPDLSPETPAAYYEFPKVLDRVNTWGLFDHPVTTRVLGYSSGEKAHVVVTNDTVGVFFGNDLPTAKLVKVVPIRRPRAPEFNHTGAGPEPSPFPGVPEHAGPMPKGAGDPLDYGALRRGARGEVLHGPLDSALEDARRLLESQVATNPFAKPALRMLEAGRISVYDYGNIARRYSPEVAESIFSRPLEAGEHLPGLEASFVQDRPAEEIAQTLVHEADHFLHQHVRQWTSLERLEFEARVAEREYARTEIAVGRPAPKSATGVTAESTDEDLWSIVIRTYQTEGEEMPLSPGWAVDVTAAADEYLTWLRDVLLPQLK